MDSSNPACAKRKDQEAMTVTCKRTKFMATYQRQNFSMPDSVIFYVVKNPKTAELYLKMVKTCKYFFVKQPIIIVPNLRAGNGKWRCGEGPLNLIKYICKYWITGEIYATASEFVDKNIFSPVIPKLYRCDVKCLSLSDQIISYHDLSLIISSAEWIKFTNVIVKHSDNSDVPLEDIVSIAVNAKFVYVIKPTITSKTMKYLTKLLNFTKLDDLDLYNLS
uniref:Uncharacterized protein n=1 Tax=Panagrolaimus sp. PS1159 TaxID=55785 RepID=A0AC35FMP9_9BILA